MTKIMWQQDKNNRLMWLGRPEGQDKPRVFFIAERRGYTFVLSRTEWDGEHTYVERTHGWYPTLEAAKAAARS